MGNFDELEIFEKPLAFKAWCPECQAHTVLVKAHFRNSLFGGCENCNWGGRAMTPVSDTNRRTVPLTLKKALNTDMVPDISERMFYYRRVRSFTQAEAKCLAYADALRHLINEAELTSPATAALAVRLGSITGKDLTGWQP